MLVGLGVAGCALASGILLDLLAAGIDIKIAAHSHWMLPIWIKYACAAALPIVLTYALWSRSRRVNIHEH